MSDLRLRLSFQSYNKGDFFHEIEYDYYLMRTVHNVLRLFLTHDKQINIEMVC